MTPEQIIEAQATNCLKLMNNNPAYMLDDLVNEGYICLQDVKRCWKPSGGATFSTYLTTALINRFRNIRFKFYQQPPCVDLDSLELGNQPDSGWANQKTSTVCLRAQSFVGSAKATQFLRLVFSPPRELKVLLRQRNRRPMSSIISDWLGWSRPTLRKIRREIEEAIIP